MASRKIATLVALSLPAVLSQSQPWPIAEYRQPSEFFANRPTPDSFPCEYQITLLRDSGDYASTLFFEAQYANSPPRMVPYVQPGVYWGPSAGPGVGWQREAPDAGLYRVSADSVRPYYLLPGACSNGSAQGYSGEEPTSFRVIADAPWSSDPFPAQTIPRPDDVPFFEIQAGSLEDDSVRFDWPVSAGAQRYVVVVEGRYFDDRDRFQYRTYINEGADNTTLIVPGAFRCRQAAILPEAEPGVYARSASSSDIVGF